MWNFARSSAIFASETANPATDADMIVQREIRMKTMIAAAVFALAGSLAFGHADGSLPAAAQILPQPGTILLCSLCAGLMPFFGRRQ